MTAQIAEVISLAELLADEMHERGWRTEELASRMNTPNGFAIDLLTLDIIMCVSHRKPVTISDDFYSGLGRAMGVNAQFFKNIHDMWSAHPEKQSSFDVPDDIFGPVSRRAVIRLMKP